MTELDELYRVRFDERSRRGKMEVWQELARFLQRWVQPDHPVVDVACDAGYFIRHVKAKERWATDVRDVEALLPRDVRFCQADGLSLGEKLPARYFGTVFMSNYLEHLPDSGSVLRQMRVAADLLRPGGRLIVLQPNIRLVGGRYWDFIDHHVALTERSLAEAAELGGLRTLCVIPRFLPYTTKGRLPQDRHLVRLYLRFPPAWWLLGKQTLYIAERPA